MKNNYILPPTMEPDEIEFFQSFMKENITSNKKFVEWGSGGSTEMFLDYFNDNNKMISIEHNEEWYEKVTNVVKTHKNSKNFTYLYIPSLVEKSFYGYGVPYEESPCFNKNYINPESCQKEVKIFDADFYLVDGISRGAVLATIHSKAKKESVIFVHDYVGREHWYNWASDLFSKTEKICSTLVKITF